MDNIVVITIIAVFWLSGLLMTWSMCIVAARADRRMEERGRGCRPDGHQPRGIAGTHHRRFLHHDVGRVSQSPCLISQARHVDCPGTDFPQGIPVPGHVRF